MKFLSLIAVFFLSTPIFAGSPVDSCKSPAGESTLQANARLTQKLLLAGLRYAREHSHPITGFVEDTVENYSDVQPTGRIRASISSTGFLMALVADLYVKGMVSHDEAYSYCERPLAAVLKKQGEDSLATAQRKLTGAQDPFNELSFEGWFSHFIDWATGDRWIDSNTHKGVEYATTDSTWFLSGAMVCAGVFPNSQVSRDFDKIFTQVNFHAFMTDGGAQPDKRTLSMAYTPDDSHGASPAGTGYSKAQWEIYQHSWLVYLLGMGTPVADFRLPAESWSAWRRTGEVLTGELNGVTLYGNKRALFSHYFPDVFMPPQDVHEACGIDYFKNSQIATRFNRLMALGDSTSKTFTAGIWGLDAGPNPAIANLTLGSPLAVQPDNTVRYGVNTPYKRNGTACPACAVAAVMFEPDLVLNDLRSWCDNPEFGDLLWGKYGPTNGIDLDYGWVSPQSLSGIVGPMALSVANLDPATSVWEIFKRSSIVRAGLKSAALAPLPANGCLIPE